MMKWTKCAIRFLRISRPGVRVPSIAPRKITRFTVKITVKKRCKSWDFLLYIAVKMAGKCDKNATNSRKTCLCDSVRPCSVCFALYHTAV